MNYNNYDSSRACYRILDVNGFYGPDDHLYPMDSEIYYDGEPNEEMEPLTEPARLKLQIYLDKLDNLAREAALKTNKPFVARPRTLDGAVELATSFARNNVPIMGKKSDSRVIEAVEQGNVPEAGSSNPQKSRGRPVGSKNKPSLAA